MRHHAATITLAITLATLLGACGQRAAPPAAAPPLRAASTPPASSDATESLWHLRAGLNVAALTCRGRSRTNVAPAYARMLGHHRALLASAYAAEQRRYGSSFDAHQTRLYNRFSNQRSPERFCAAAADLAQRAAAMDSPALASNARSLLSHIE